MEYIYLDTNAFYFFFFEHEKYTRGIKRVISKIHRGVYRGITSCITLDELAYVILMRLIEKKYKRHPSEILRENKSVILEFVDSIKDVFDVIFSLNNIEIVGIDKDIMATIPIIMEESTLLPRDCIHLQTMRNKNCKLILSTDTDFDDIDGIKRIKPDEL